MAITALRITVADTATLLMDPAGNTNLGPGAVMIKNAGGASVFMGGPAVTKDDGTELASGEFISLDLRWDDVLYAVTASGTIVCHVLKLRQ
jgi:hypothetical protein